MLFGGAKSEDTREAWKEESRGLFVYICGMDTVTRDGTQKVSEFKNCILSSYLHC